MCTRISIMYTIGKKLSAWRSLVMGNVLPLVKRGHSQWSVPIIVGPVACYKSKMVIIWNCSFGEQYILINSMCMHAYICNYVNFTVLVIFINLVHAL